MSSLRTLHLIDSLGAGGAERSLAELVLALGAHGCDPIVAVLQSSEEGVHAEVKAQVPVLHIAGRSRVARAQALRRVLRDTRPDVLHTTLFESDVVGRLAASGHRTPKVVSSFVGMTYDRERLHSSEIRRYRLRLAQALDAATAHARSDAFHAISEAAADSAAQHLRIRREDIVVIPRGRRRERLGYPGLQRRALARHGLSISPGELVVCHVGREDHAKALVDLISALSEVHARKRDVVLVTAGRRGNASRDISAALTRVSYRYCRLGHVEEVPDLLAAADVFAFPSVHEGLGGAVLEAMALEVPIVASSIPALTELLGTEAVLVPSRNPSALARGILTTVVDVDATRRRVASARRRFDARFEHDRVVDQMADMFKAIAAPR